MATEKKRYKAVIDNQSYTIIGRENSTHMDVVTKLVNEQLNEIKKLSSQIDNEQAAILLSVNAISDQLKKQHEILVLKKQNEELKQKAIKVVELENKVKRIEAIESEARAFLESSGRTDLEITNHVEAQQVLNEQRKREIKQKAVKE
ncbi:MAG: cell division protein ZapA [Enterococcus sp.]